jgi:hypothetical protein
MRMSALNHFHYSESTVGAKGKTDFNLSLEKQKFHERGEKYGPTFPFFSFVYPFLN